MEKFLLKNRIRDIRKKSGLTAEEVAIRANTSQPQIFRLEAGERDLNLVWMYRLSKALNCEPYELLPEEWQPRFSAELPSCALDNIADIIETVEVWLKENKKELEPRKKALLIKTLYEETAGLSKEDKITNIITLTNFLMKNAS